jgi:hypothetical protein
MYMWTEEFVPKRSGAPISPTLGSTDHAYVVLSKSIGWDVDISVYELRPAQSIGDFPIHLVPESYREWPQASQPISQISKALKGKYVSGIRKISVVGQRDYLLILGERDDVHSSPVFIRFNLESKQWTDVALAVQGGTNDSPEKQ